MGTILASSLIDTISRQLFDINGVQWSRTELLDWISDGQRQITLMVPESANTVRTPVQMVAGTTQNIPSDGWMILDVSRNMGPYPGSTPGRVLRLADRKLLDAFNPNWHTDTAVAAPTNWVFDPQSVTQFWVYPPSDGSGFVELSYAQIPADLTAETSPISVSNIFETPLIDYVMYRACAKQAPYSPGVEKAAAYWAAFSESIAAKSKAEILSDPNQTLGHPPPDQNGAQ